MMIAGGWGGSAKSLILSFLATHTHFPYPAVLAWRVVDSWVNCDFGTKCGQDYSNTTPPLLRTLPQPTQPPSGQKIIS